jgi:hypothetical protein
MNKGLENRIRKLEGKLNPDSEFGYTLEDLFRASWRADKQRYLQIANSPDGWMYQRFIKQFESEDRERC